MVAQIVLEVLCFSNSAIEVVATQLPDFLIMAAVAPLVDHFNGLFWELFLEGTDKVHRIRWTLSAESSQFRWLGRTGQVGIRGIRDLLGEMFVRSQRGGSRSGQGELPNMIKF